jgi:twitching motility protein PilJ
MTAGELAALQADVDRDPTDLVAKISLASALEQSDRIHEAKSLYEEVVNADPTGTMGAVAKQALEALGIPVNSANSEIASVAKTPTLQKRSSLQWFYNLPISYKQALALVLSQGIAILGLSIGSRFIFETGLYALLHTHAKSETSVTEANYNIKVNQLGFEGKTLVTNSHVINAARAKANNQNIDSATQQQIKQIFQQELKLRHIEYLTLVGKDSRIIVNANANRQGEVFNANNLVSEALTNSKQITTSEIVNWTELVKESPLLPPGFKNQDGLIRYVVTPVKDPNNSEIIGAIIAGDVVNGKWSIVEDSLNTFGSGYSAIYFRNSQGKFVLATSLNHTEKGLQPNVALPDESILTAAAQAPKRSVNAGLELGEQEYTIVAKSIANFAGKPIAFIVRGTPEKTIESLLASSARQEAIMIAIALLIVTIWALILRQLVIKPIVKLQKTTLKFATGDRDARAEVFASDEVGQLAITFNQMADSINTSTDAIEAQSRQRQAEAEFQRQEKERLQQGVIHLLLEIEEAKRGDLTVRARVDETEMGSIADAFNATIRSLSEIVTQVKTAAAQVHDSAYTNENSAEKLSSKAIAQSQALTTALNSVQDIGQSIQTVATSAQKAAAIARQAVLNAQKSSESMDLTVGSMENIRATAAETTKKVKRLAESSQEISKIVNLISGISEKTNLLAFNASIEASRAGENGQGFRVVADEVRRLAERVTDSTKEIEQLVNAIQQETAEVLQTMEASTTQVVTGTELVAKTKQTLGSIARISHKIDQLLQSISSSTVSQAQASAMVNQTMQEVAAIAQSNSDDSKAVAVSLEQLVGVAQELQRSVSRFQVEK